MRDLLFIRGFAVLRRSFVLCALAAACTADDGPSFSIAADTVVTIVTVGSVMDSTKVRVSVAGDTTPIAGRFTLRDGAVVFRPAFPFDSGRDYEVRIAGKRAPSIHGFRLPASTARAAVRVTAIYPSPDVIPENQLRFYVEFSGPMSREGGLPYVRLLDAGGKEVKDAFLPLDADFWNREHTRYTLFLDPGRVKRGILPNEQMGRALVAGRSYSIVVDSTWRDGRGQPLVASYVKRFRAGPADFQRITPSAWRVQPPRAGTRDALVIRFNEPLDRGLLLRAVGVELEDGQLVDGDVEISAGDDEWRFAPRQAWPPGSHRVVVLDFLEDLGGNRVNRAFEVDLFQRADSSAAPTRITIPFRVR